MDFNKAKKIGQEIEADFQQLKYTGGYDHNYVTDNYAKGSRRTVNPDGAYVFIDYMLSDTAQQILVKEMAAIPLVDVSGMDMTGYEDLKDLDVGSFRTLSIGDLGTNFNERWDNEIGSLG